MSSEYYTRNSLMTSEKIPNIVGKLDPSSNLGYLPRNSIPWSKTLSDELLQFFENCNYPYRHIYDIPFKEPLRSEIRRFFISLDAYKESSNPVMSDKDLLYGATLRDYSETLKRIRRKSFQTSWTADNFVDPDWWKDIPDYRINDIGDIFNYSYLIFWEMEEPDDYLNGFIDVNIDDQYIQKYKDTLEDLLPEPGSFNKIDEIEVLTTISSSMSYDSKKKEKSPHYRLKPKRLFFSKKISAAKRSVIRVSPNNTRDSVILDPSDLNTISLMDKQIMEILSRMENHLHLKNKDLIQKRIRKLHKDYIFFIQRDLKKEGIMKPREILSATLEVLSIKYPDIEIFRNTDFYNSFSLLNGDQELYPQRGHGLGMANTITTLMQLTIHHLIVNELVDDIPELDTRELALNDDFTVGFNDEYHLDSYWDKEDEILEKLSIIRAPEKSFTTRYCFVIAENYITNQGLDPKESYQRRELLLPLTCYNITHAKEYFIAAQSYTNNDLHRLYLDEIRSYWGYEFYPDEFMYPYRVGGWINDFIGGVDMSLVIIDKLPLKDYVFRGFKASGCHPYIKKKGEMYHSPFYLLYGQPKIPDEFLGNFDLLTKHEISWKYGRILANSNKEFRRYWDDFRNQRMKVFKKPLSMTYEELIISIKHRYKSVQFYPSDSMISRYHKGNYIQVNISDPYIDPNPRVALLAKYNCMDHDFKDSFSIRFSNPDEFSKKRSSLLSKEADRSTKSAELNNLLIGSFDEIYYPEESFNPQEQYFNPIGIGRVTALLNWGYGYPEVREQFTDCLIEEKREIFGRFLSLEELLYISTVKVNRRVIKKILDHDINHDLTIIIPQIIPRITQDEPEVERVIEEDEEIIPDDPYIITMTDLMEPGIPKLWSYRNDVESYRFADESSRYHTAQLDNLIVILTFPGLYKPEDRVYELDKYERSSHMARVILSRSGLKTFSQRDFFDDQSDSEGIGFDLFDGG
jgi:hypothetical protein